MANIKLKTIAFEWQKIKHMTKDKTKVQAAEYKEKEQKQNIPALITIAFEEKNTPAQTAFEGKEKKTPALITIAFEEKENTQKRHICTNNHCLWKEKSRTHTRTNNYFLWRERAKPRHTCTINYCLWKGEMKHKTQLLWGACSTRKP